MLRRASSLLLAIPLLVPASVLAATYSGPPAGVVPPNGNVPGLIWNFQDSADANAVQTGAQIRVGATGIQQKILGNVVLTNGGILGPSAFGSGSSTVANYFSNGYQPFQMNVRGGVNVERIAPASPSMPDQDGRVQARKFCLNPVSNVPDCITAWPTPAAAPDLSAYVQKAGDTMTGTLNVATGAIPYGINVSGPSTAVSGVGTNYGVYGRSTLSNGYGLFGQNVSGFGVFADGNIGGRLRGQTTGAEIYGLGAASLGLRVDGPTSDLFFAEGGARAMRIETSEQEGVVVNQSTAVSPTSAIRVTQPAGKGTGLSINGGERGINIAGVTGVNSQGIVVQSENQGIVVDVNNPIGVTPEAGRFEAGVGAGIRQVILAESAGNAIEATGPVMIKSNNGNPNFEILSSGEVSSKGPNAGYYFFDRTSAARQFAWYAYNDEARLYHYSTLPGAQLGTFLTVNGANGNTYNRKNIASWDVASDARLKTVEGDYSRGLADILKVQPVDFRYKDMPEKNLDSKELRHGVVAQELAKSFPDAVTKGSDGYYSVNTDPVFWASVNAIKELKAENDQLKARLDAIEAKLK